MFSVMCLMLAAVSLIGIFCLTAAKKNPSPKSSLQRIETTEAPKAFGPYSQGVTATLSVGQKLIFVSGMLPMDPMTGKLLEGDIKLLTRQVIMNLEAVLKAGNSSLHNVVRTDIFLKDMKNDFSSMNEEYAQWFTSQTAPARQTVQISELPLGSRIEISCIAVANEEV